MYLAQIVPIGQAQAEDELQGARAAVAVEVEQQRAVVEGVYKNAAGGIGERVVSGVVDFDRSQAGGFGKAGGERVAGIGKDVFGVVVGQVDHAVAPIAGGRVEVVADDLVDDLLGFFGRGGGETPDVKIG